jgi:hypothetical protein
LFPALRVEARELLTPIYSWFTEGFDNADLQDAKMLLQALSREKASRPRACIFISSAGAGGLGKRLKA